MSRPSGRPCAIQIEWARSRIQVTVALKRYTASLGCLFGEPVIAPYQLQKSRKMIVPTPEFEEQLVSFMPKLRVWALAMTRNHAAADDLVQEVAAKALAANNAFEAGTNFGAWMHRIMINQFITGIRSQRNFVGLELTSDLQMKPVHEDRTALRELGWAVSRLPTEQREALLMIAVDEDSYNPTSAVRACFCLKTRRISRFSHASANMWC
jgi:RNA polymerase sigma-70 factor (ECF subfamily)